jgi:hypothetical protein
MYEWQLRLTPDGSTGQAVHGGRQVGIDSTVADDFVFYDPRQYGINLTSRRDEGKFNGRHWWDEVGEAISGGFSLVFNGSRRAFGDSWVVWTSSQASLGFAHLRS